jgi:hypothetical protein
MGLKAEEYRRKAEEADFLARKTLDLHASDTYHSVASCYRELADCEDRQDRQGSGRIAN